MTELRIAVEQGQNFAARFQENLRLVMPIRSALYFLPQALERFEQEHPGISVTPGFDWHRGIEAFLKASTISALPTRGMCAICQMCSCILCLTARFIW